MVNTVDSENLNLTVIHVLYVLHIKLIETDSKTVKSNAHRSDCRDKDKLAKMIFAEKTHKENLKIKRDS